MMERIRQLAEQAEVKWQHQEDVIYSTMTLEQFEKFAQLIVAECIGEVYPENFKVDGVEPANLADAVKRIKQHFGVEE